MRADWLELKASVRGTDSSSKSKGGGWLPSDAALGDPSVAALCEGIRRDSTPIVPSTRRATVYYGLLLNDEMDVLSLVLEETARVPSVIPIVVEANETFRGQPKELIFHRYADHFRSLNPRVRHVAAPLTALIGEECAVLSNEARMKSSTCSWKAELASRSAMMAAMDDAHPLDVTIIADADELVAIPLLEALSVCNVFSHIVPGNGSTWEAPADEGGAAWGQCNRTLHLPMHRHEHYFDCLRYKSTPEFRRTQSTLVGCLEAPPADWALAPGGTQLAAATRASAPAVVPIACSRVYRQGCAHLRPKCWVKTAGWHMHVFQSTAQFMTRVWSFSEGLQNTGGACNASLVARAKQLCFDAHHREEWSSEVLLDSLREAPLPDVIEDAIDEALATQAASASFLSFAAALEQTRGWARHAHLVQYADHGHLDAQGVSTFDTVRSYCGDRFVEPEQERQ